MTDTLTESRALADAYCRGRNTQGGYPCDGLCADCRSRTTSADYAAVIDQIRLIMAPPPSRPDADALIEHIEHIACDIAGAIVHWQNDHDAPRIEDELKAAINRCWLLASCIA